MEIIFYFFFSKKNYHSSFSPLFGKRTPLPLLLPLPEGEGLRERMNASPLILPFSLGEESNLLTPFPFLREEKTISGSPSGGKGWEEGYQPFNSISLSLIFCALLNYFVFLFLSFIICHLEPYYGYSIKLNLLFFARLAFNYL